MNRTTAVIVVLAFGSPALATPAECGKQKVAARYAWEKVVAALAKEKRAAWERSDKKIARYDEEIKKATARTPATTRRQTRRQMQRVEELRLQLDVAGQFDTLMFQASDIGALTRRPSIHIEQAEQFPPGLPAITRAKKASAALWRACKDVPGADEP